MGYTHYLSLDKSKIGKKGSQYETKYQFAIQQCNRVIKGYNKDIKAQDSKHPARLSGYSVHTKGEYLGVKFNGTQELMHEDFYLEAHLLMNEGFIFCKTALKPYDSVVVACCLILVHYLPELYQFESDGNSLDMRSGQILIEDYLQMSFDVPTTIQRVFKAV